MVSVHDAKWKMRVAADADAFLLAIEPVTVRPVVRQVATQNARAEREASIAAKEFTGRAVASARIVLVRNPKWGKWGGRVVADFILDGRSLSAALIATGHGRAYNGGRRGSWRGGPRAIERIF